MSKIQFISSGSLEKVRTDFEERTVTVLKEQTDNISKRELRKKDKLAEIKSKKRRKIRRDTEIQRYMGGLSLFVDYLKKGINLSLSIPIIGLIWILIELKKKITEGKLKIINKTEFPRKAAKDDYRSVFRESWNKSLDGSVFLSAVLFMALLNEISPSIYQGSFEYYQSNIQKLLEGESIASIVKDTIF